MNQQHDGCLHHAGLVSQVSERVLETARWWRAVQPGEMKGNLGKFHPAPITIPFDDPSTAFMRDFRRFADEEYSKAEDRNDVVAMTVWGRANENARKLALIYACSENHQNPEVALPTTQWVSEFVTYQIRRQLFKAKDHAANWVSCRRNSPTCQRRWTTRSTRSRRMNEVRIYFKALANSLSELHW